MKHFSSLETRLSKPKWIVSFSPGLRGTRYPANGLFDWNIVAPAIADSFRKLDPRLMVKNPVMFVTQVGAALTTIGIFTASAERGFIAQLALWLWFTVLFANFAEAVAEGRGKAQANALRKARKDTMARRLRSGREEKVPAAELQKGDIVVCEANDIIPADGDVIEGAQRQKTPNEIALTILLAALTFIFLLVCVTLKPFGIYSATLFSVPVLIALLVCLIPTTIGGLLSAIGIAGMDRVYSATYSR